MQDPDPTCAAANQSEYLYLARRNSHSSRLSSVRSIAMLPTHNPSLTRCPLIALVPGSVWECHGRERKASRPRHTRTTALLRQPTLHGLQPPNSITGPTSNAEWANGSRRALTVCRRIKIAVTLLQGPPPDGISGQKRHALRTRDFLVDPPSSRVDEQLWDWEVMHGVRSPFISLSLGKRRQQTHHVNYHRSGRGFGRVVLADGADGSRVEGKGVLALGSANAETEREGLTKRRRTPLDRQGFPAQDTSRRGDVRASRRGTPNRAKEGDLFLALFSPLERPGTGMGELND